MGFFVIPSLLRGLDYRDRTVPGNWYFCLSLTVLSETFDVIFLQFSVFLLFFCRKSAAFSMEEKTAFGSNELYSCHALQLKRIYISAFILLLAAISYLIIQVDK